MAELRLARVGKPIPGRKSAYTESGYVQLQEKVWAASTGE